MLANQIEKKIHTKYILMNVNRTDLWQKHVCFLL